MQREKLNELDLARAFAILGVLMVHSTSFATLSMVETSMFGVYNFLNIFFKVGTTTFIFLSSFVLFYNYYPQPLTKQRFAKFYRNRLMYILVPYVVFSILYFGLRMYQNGATLNGDTFAKFWRELATGKAYTHLYFVFISIQFYVLFPILLLFFQKFRRLAPYAFLIGVVLQWAFIILNKYEFQVVNRGSWSLGYFTYYFLGAWIGMYFDRFRAWLVIAREHATRSRVAGWIGLWIVWLATGIGHVYMWYNTRLHGAKYNTTLFDAMWNAHTLTTAIVFLQIAFLLYRRAPGSAIVHRIRHLGAVSFGVYLFHPLVLLIYRKFPVTGGTPMKHHLWYAGGYVCALILSWIVVTAISRLTPKSWVLFGSVPAQLAALDRSRGSEQPAPKPSVAG